jgi:hypothetical protein
MLVLALMALASPAAARPKPEEPRGGRLCDAISVEGTESGQIRSIRMYSSSWAASHVRRLGKDSAFWITLHGRIRCDGFREQLAAVLLADDELVALQSHGWRIGEVVRMRVDRVAVHRVSASRGNQRISYVRPGGSAPVDGANYRAGQTLWFDRSGTTCTSAFVLRLPDARLAGLSAGHCSAGPAWAPPQYPGGPPIYVTDNVVRDRTTLGPVVQNMNLQEQGPDALVFALDGAPSAAQQIDRGAHTPHRVTGVLPGRSQRKGRVVCFTGHTSGGDRCGRIDGASTWFGRRVICVRARGKLSDHGDSGGPVYTRPVEGRVQAVGIVSRSSVGGRLRDMCYTPIQDILESFGADLPMGSFAAAGARSK